MRSYLQNVANSVRCTSSSRKVIMSQLWLWKITPSMPLFLVSFRSCYGEPQHRAYNHLDVMISTFPEKCDLENPDNPVHTVYSAITKEILNYCGCTASSGLLRQVSMACVNHIDKQFSITKDDTYTIRSAFASLISDVVSIHTSALKCRLFLTLYVA
jgi:hypothetical protein